MEAFALLTEEERRTVTEDCEDAYPLSILQAGMVFHTQLEEFAGIYHDIMAEHVKCPWDRRCFEQALAACIQEQPVLRTRFSLRGSRPLQHVQRSAELPLTVEDLRSVPPDGQERHIARWMDARRPHVFDWERGPLLHVRIFLRSETSLEFVLSFHHALMDGWSRAMLTTALYERYARLLSGQTPEPVSTDWTYREFIAQELRHLADPEAGKYFTGMLKDVTAEQLPRLPAAGAARSQVRTRIAPFMALSAGVIGLARQMGMPLQSLLLAAHLKVLATVSGQTRALSCVTHHARPEAAGADRTLGLFLNALPLAVELDPETWRELVARVNDAEADGMRYCGYPLARIQQDLGWACSEVLLNYTHYHIYNDLARGAGAGLEALRSEGFEQTNFDLVVDVSRGRADDTLALTLIYDAAVFDAELMARLGRYYVQAFRLMLQDLNRPHHDQSLLSKPERDHLLYELNDTAADYRRELCLHQMFEAHAERAPRAVAVVFEGVTLSYDELNRRACRLARHLQSLGVRPGRFVGILLERSIDMIVGVLAVLKSGGAYVPFEMHWPAERIRWILQSVGIGCVLTQSSQLRRMQPMQWSVSGLSDLVLMDEEGARPAPEPLDRDAVRSLWDYVAESAVDSVTAGGFISSYTGRPFSETEVDEYRDHLVGIAGPFLHPDARVLEIGCGAGLIMYEIASRVARYTGFDSSELTQSRNRAYLGEQDILNLELQCGFAHEIDSLPAGTFDLVIIASTVQFFPGLVYLERVIEKALRRLRAGGTVVVADVMDARRSEEFEKSLEEFKSAHADDPAIRTRAATPGAELCVDEGLFHDFQSEFGEIESVDVLHRKRGFENELRYRYDVIIRKSQAATEAARPPRRKRLWTRRDLDGYSDSNLTADVTSNDAAYIIFTSGSTGVPKGVLVRHEPVVNLVEWVNRTFAVGQADRMLFITSLCFDLSVYDILGILAAGASIQIAPESALKDPESLLRILCQPSITFWDSAPAALQQLVPFLSSLSPGGSLENLRLVFLSGDWIPVKLPDQIRAVFNRAEVVALGGGTEATIWSNFYPVGKVDPSWKSIPYGRPIQNAHYYVLDRHLLPCPVGTPGDLYIGGRCLASGYFNDAAQTVERFIPDAIGGEAGARLYRTGDRARFWADGNMEFLGRSDQQVKIRGYRIEPGEIESVLVRHAAVAQAVVVPREDFGDKSLVAYVVPKAGKSVVVHELRGFVGDKLPHYMLPSAFVVLDNIPVTVNGKVDRAALPAPDRDRSASKAEYVPPGSELEERIAPIWADVLRVGVVGIHDNFFDLGGHSFHAVEVHGRLCREFKREIPLLRMFQYPTIHSLAAWLGDGGGLRADAGEQSRIWAERRRDAMMRQRQMRRN